MFSAAKPEKEAMEVKPLEPKPNQTHRFDYHMEEPKQRTQEPNQIQEAKQKIQELKQSLLLPKGANSTIEVPKRQKTPKMEDLKQVAGKKQDRIQQRPHNKTSSLVWDCGSTLYDSFELNSFKRQLDSAISASSARTLSMPHLPDRRAPPLPMKVAPPIPKKPSNKISRSLQKLLKSVFKPKSSSAPSSPVFKAYGDKSNQYSVVYETTGALTTIPETVEIDVGPEISSLVRRTASERLTLNHAIMSLI